MVCVCVQLMCGCVRVIACVLNGYVGGLGGRGWGEAGDAFFPPALMQTGIASVMIAWHLRTSADSEER